MSPLPAKGNTIVTGDVALGGEKVIATVYPSRHSFVAGVRVQYIPRPLLQHVQDAVCAQLPALIANHQVVTLRWPHYPGVAIWFHDLEAVVGRLTDVYESPEEMG